MCSVKCVMENKKWFEYSLFETLLLLKDTKEWSEEFLVIFPFIGFSEKGCNTHEWYKIEILCTLLHKK